MQNDSLPGANIRRAREQMGLTQAGVAARLNISRVSYLNIEAGRRSISNDEAVIISTLFDLSVEALLVAAPVVDLNCPEPQFGWAYITEDEAAAIKALRAGNTAEMLRLIARMVR
jgi:transcriptional regulator with XRE-family HTH domain